MSWLDQLAEIRRTNWSEATPEARQAKSQEVVTISGYAAAAAAVVPVPMAELALLLPIHTAMVMTIGHVHGRSVSKTEAARVVAELGAIAGLTFAGTAALAALRKILLPGLGGVLAAPASFALTWALGRVAIEYFENPSLSRDQLKKVFQDAMREGKSVFSTSNLDDFRQRYGEGEDVARRADAETNPDTEGESGADRPAAPETHDGGSGPTDPELASADPEAADPPSDSGPAGPASEPERKKRTL
jgi:uncharacterized protein (DUF697 family)